MPKNSLLVGHLAAIMTIFIWGTTFVSTKVLLTDFQPLEILFLRFLLGFFALSIAYPHRLKLTDSSQRWYFMGAGLCGITLYFLMENIALTYTLVANVSILACMSPFFMAILIYFFSPNEKLNSTFFIGFVVAITGVILISFNGNMVLNLNPIGDILALGAAFVWALYSLLTQKISTFGYNIIQVTRLIFFYGLMFMLPMLFVLDFNPDFSKLLKTTNLLNIIFLGFGASAVCFATWNFSLQRLGTIKTSIYIYLVPVVAVVTAVLILDETITTMSIIGIILTLIGLIISENKLSFLRKTK